MTQACQLGLSKEGAAYEMRSRKFTCAKLNIMSDHFEEKSIRLNVLTSSSIA